MALMLCSTSRPQDASTFERWKKKYRSGKARLKSAASPILEAARTKTCSFVDRRQLATAELVFEPHDFRFIEDVEPPPLIPVSSQEKGMIDMEAIGDNSLPSPDLEEFRSVEANADDVTVLHMTEPMPTTKQLVPVNTSAPSRFGGLGDCLAFASLHICCGNLRKLRNDHSDMEVPLSREESLRFHMTVHGVSFDETDNTESITSQSSARARSVLHRMVSRSQSWLPPVAEIPNFSGSWVCTSTWGLDAFLEKCGISKIQRMAATRAPWPSWEFRQTGDAVTFINNGAFGALQETFVIDGPEFIVIDGRKQKLTCRAYWESSKLVIERSGPHGRFREERSILDDGTLYFSLSSLEEAFANASWGRTFKRKKG
mmetsp:Transcript_83262/g.131420  ORF Transcript_83262/g.131420 Transcript_83262/m.131420 type:complete len:372 (-) Transcript_83262:205-1320(-)